MIYILNEILCGWWNAEGRGVGVGLTVERGVAWFLTMERGVAWFLSSGAYKTVEETKHNLRSKMDSYS